MNRIQGPLLGKWRRFQNRLPEERLLILQAAVFMPLTSLGLRFLGFRRWKEWVEKWSPPGNPPRFRSGEAGQEIAQRRIRAVRSAELHGLGTPNCLERSLALWWLLRRDGIDAELHIGAAKRDGRFEAHAWVEWDGQVLNDSADVHRHYMRFDAPIAAGAAGHSAEIRGKS